MRDFIKGIGEVKYNHVDLLSAIKLPKEVMGGRNELGLTGIAQSKAMVD